MLIDPPVINTYLFLRRSAPQAVKHRWTTEVIYASYALLCGSEHALAVNWSEAILYAEAFPRATLQQ
jgi:hypothetical protein